MSRITRELALQHTRLQVLIQAAPAIAQSWLAPFERELVEDVRRRREAFGENAPVTEAEAVVLRLALDGMECGLRRAFVGQAKPFLEMLDRAAVQIGDAA